MTSSSVLDDCGLTEAQLLAYATPKLDVNGAFHHSKSISEASTEAVAKLILQDAREHDAFINEGGFHNHIIHAVLAQYSFGASAAHLESWYAKHASDTRPATKSPNDFDWGSEKCLGNMAYYASYLRFFLKQVHENGVEQTITKFIFQEGEKEHQMLQRFLGGAFHPMIHVGYGVEFGIPLLVAEGLAQTACHGTDATGPFAGVAVADTAVLSKTDDLYSRVETPLGVVRNIRADDLLGDVSLSSVRGGQYESVLRNDEACLRICDYIDSYNLPETKADLGRKVGEMLAFSAAMYGATRTAIKDKKLDFFLMHSLTSSLFMPAFTDVLDHIDALRLVKLKFAVDIAWFVSRKCPDFDLDHYKSVESRSWEELCESAQGRDDEHVPKVIRSLKQAGDYDATFMLGAGDKAMADQVYRGIAELTLEVDGDWDFAAGTST